MSNSPLVTIITPCYNSESTLSKTVESVLCQSYANIEYIIIDDCSKDSSYNIALGYLDDPRVKVLRNAVNSKVAETRNRGLQLANGKYICFLDSDDWWSPMKLKAQVEFMEDNNLCLSYMDYYRVFDNSQMRLVRCPDKADIVDMLCGNVIANLTAMVRRDDIASLRFLNIGHEDYMYWLSVMRSREIVARRVPTDDGLSYYKVAAGSLSSNKIKAMSWQWNIYRFGLNLPFLHSLYFFSRYLISAFLKRL